MAEKEKKNQEDLPVQGNTSRKARSTNERVRLFVSLMLFLLTIILIVLFKLGYDSMSIAGPIFIAMGAVIFFSLWYVAAKKDKEEKMKAANQANEEKQNADQ